MPPEQNLDVKGLACPLPVLKARKALKSMPSGSVLAVEATDPAAVIDFPHFCNESGNELVEHSAEDGVFRFRIRKR